MVAQASQVFTLLLAGIASVSLLVGGIGIMNIMLVSVTERTREIGIRMAMGARRLDIQLQFLVEALVLSLLGGTLGVLLGVVGSWVLARMTGWNALVSPSSILLSFGFAAIVGVFFGFYPARQASRLDPIEALRYE
jgi:putative ABC transport system permease protein